MINFFFYFFLNYKIAKDLIKRLLVLEPEKRLDSEKILNHPWMKKNVWTENLDGVAKKIYECSTIMKKFKVLFFFFNYC